MIGAPIAAAGGVAGTLARQNAMRNPKRTSRTGGALMVGVALVAAITVLAASVKDWTRDAVGSLFTGDYVVSTSMSTYGGLSPDLQHGDRRAPRGLGGGGRPDGCRPRRDDR